MQILYEPVAVRHKTILLISPKATFRDKPLDLKSEKAGQESAESKYPDNPKSFRGSHEPDCEGRSLEGNTNLRRMYMQKKCRNQRNLFCGTLYLRCMALIVAMALFTAGCGKKGDESSSGASQSAGTVYDDGSSIGEGSTKFSLTVADKDGNETHMEIHTDKETVGDALLELGVISGDESEYGIFVKTVNGITADYDADGVYWAFYVNGEYATSGVDSTPVTADADYAFKVE